MVASGALWAFFATSFAAVNELTDKGPIACLSPTDGGAPPPNPPSGRSLSSSPTGAALGRGDLRHRTSRYFLAAFFRGAGAKAPCRDRALVPGPGRHDRLVCLFISRSWRRVRNVKRWSQGVFT